MAIKSRIPLPTGYLAPVFGIIALGGMSAPVLAQTVTDYGDAVPSQGASVPIPVTSVNRDISVTLYASAVYDSNVARARRFEAEGANLDRSDVYFPLGVTVNMAVPVGPNNFTLSGNVGYNIYTRNSRLSGESIGLRGGYSREFGACAVSSGASFGRRRTNYDNIASLVDADHNMQTEYGVNGTLSCGSAVGFRPYVSAGYKRGRNSSSWRELSDYNTFSYGGGLMYVSPVIGEIGVVGSIDDTRYPKRVPGDSLGLQKFKVESIGVYYRRAIARQLQTTAQVNYSRIKDGGLHRAQGRGTVSGFVAVTFVPEGRYAITARVERAVVPQLAYNADYTIDTTGSIGVAGPLTPKVSLNATASYSERRYRVSYVDPINPLTRDRLGRVTLGASYDTGTRIGLNASIGYRWRDSNSRAYEYSGMYGQIGASMRL